jgi:hypothetical protein
MIVKAGAIAAISAREKARRDRQAAYTSETDPLMGKVLRGEMTAQEFTERCEEIRRRYPYPEETA